jgi:hypothetical protein
MGIHAIERDVSKSTVDANLPLRQYALNPIRDRHFDDQELES